MKKLLAAVALATLALPAQAVTIIVDAQANSSSGGVGLPSIGLISGQAFTVSSSLDDLWNAGPLPRFSNANGLTSDRFATGSDESGLPNGTKIGEDFGFLSQNGLSAPYGSLVGEINGVYQLLGANFSGNAWGTGTLNLFYWDSDSDNNSGSITFDISPVVGAVPEPATWGMMILGFGLAGAGLRRRTIAAA